MTYSSLSSMHRATAERLGPRVALRSKRLGMYRDLSWADYRRDADRAAAALIDLGIRPGDRVALLSENRPEWLVADIAILATGAADVPLHAPLTPPQARYQLAHSGARAIVVGNQKQADKVLEVIDDLPDLEFLVSFEPVEVAGQIRQFTWDGLKGFGFGLGPVALGRVREREDAVTRDVLATIIYTSGTTGPPKGVMLSHGNLLSNAEATLETSPMESSEVLLSWLPYSHIYARTVDHYLTVLSGATVAMAESVDTLISNLAEVQPTRLTAIPRFYEKVWLGVEGLEPEVRKRHLRHIFGPRIRHLSSGGAPLLRHVAEGFHAAGLPLLEGYGLTESSPVISFNRHERHKLGSVGLAIPGVEIEIAGDGEILTRGPHVMQGYWKDPEATRETIVDGWLHTGDVGQMDDEGFLTITDRKKDLIITSGGKNIAPSELERLLVRDPYIDQAVVFGDARPFVSALIVPNFALLESKASELGCPLDTTEGFIRTPALNAFIADRVAGLMKVVSGPERVKRFLLLARAFGLEHDELTLKLNVRRRHVLQKYAGPLEALYAEPPETHP